MAMRAIFHNFLWRSPKKNLKTDWPHLRTAGKEMKLSPPPYKNPCRKYFLKTEKKLDLDTIQRTLCTNYQNISMFEGVDFYFKNVKFCSFLKSPSKASFANWNFNNVCCLIAIPSQNSTCLDLIPFIEIACAWVLE